MDDQPASGQPDERPQWRDIALTVFPPVTLVAALLVYFGWVRRNASATQLGVNPQLLGDVSVVGYLLRSVGTVWFPLVVALSGVLVWLGADRTVRRWVHEGTHRLALSVLRWAIPAGGVVLAGGGELVRMIIPGAAPYVSVARPFLAVLAVLALAYGASLRGLAARKRGAQDSVAHRWASTAVIWLLVALLLLDGMEGFAQVVGRGLAQQIVEQPATYTDPVLVYSAQDLQLDPAIATRQTLPAVPDAAYHYRYQGLRLIDFSGGNYFLIGRTWHFGGSVIVLPQDGIRIEFLRAASIAGDIR